VRTAWERALERKDATEINRTLEGLHWFCDMTSRQWQGERLFRQAEAVFNADYGDRPGLLWAHIAARASRLLALGTRLHIQDALAQIDRCLEIAKTCHDQSLTALCLSVRSYCFFSTPEFRRGLAASQESLKLYQALGDEFHAADQLAIIGWFHMNLGQYSDAIACLQAANRLHLDMGNRYHAAWSFSNWGKPLTTATMFRLYATSRSRGHLP
jgi:tetratricopeptide (TPR) repeat protein